MDTGMFDVSPAAKSTVVSSDILSLDESHRQPYDQTPHASRLLQMMMLFQPRKIAQHLLRFRPDGLQVALTIRAKAEEI